MLNQRMEIRTKAAARDSVGRRITRARRCKRPPVSRRTLAERLDAFGVVIDPAGVEAMESGRRRITYLELVALAEVLSVPLRWLVSGGEV